MDRCNSHLAIAKVEVFQQSLYEASLRAIQRDNTNSFDTIIVDRLPCKLHSDKGGDRIEAAMRLFVAEAVRSERAKIVENERMAACRVSGYRRRGLLFYMRAIAQAPAVE
jgi:hypothetical protein